MADLSTDQSPTPSSESPGPSSQSPNPSSESPNHSFKVTFMGIAGVGKTSLIHAMLNDTLTDAPKPTVAGQQFPVNVVYQDRSVSLTLWDTAGQERYHAVTPLYLRCSCVAVLVFAADYQSSFDGVTSLAATVKEVVSDASCVIVANKVDLDAERVISPEEGAAKAASLEMKYMETSAVSRYGVDEVLTAIAEMVIDKTLITVNQPVTLGENKEESHTCC